MYGLIASIAIPAFNPASSSSEKLPGQERKWKSCISDGKVKRLEY